MLTSHFTILPLVEVSVKSGEGQGPAELERLDNSTSEDIVSVIEDGGLART